MSTIEVTLIVVLVMLTVAVAFVAVIAIGFCRRASVKIWGSGT